MRPVLPALLLATALVGCGGETAAGGGASGGAHVFGHDCAACHSLVGNESRHTQGGDLLHFRMSRADLTEFSREMPLRHRMDAAQLRAVVQYVLQQQQRAR